MSDYATEQPQLTGPAAGTRDSGVVGDQYLLHHALVITVRGDVDAHTIEPLRDALEAAAAVHRVVVLDMGKVTFGDSTFLNTALRAHQRGLLRLAAVRELLLRILELTGADQVLHLYPTVKEAAAAPLT
jgi:anti-anti-sigma factor